MIHSCWRASSGEILCLGSHSKHLSMKSMKEGLEFWRIMCRDFESGILHLPLELGVRIGSSVLGSKNIFLRVDCSRTESGGIPLTSIIIDNYSISLSPGKIGNPVKSSIKMQPKLHMSIAVV